MMTYILNLGIGIDKCSVWRGQSVSQKWDKRNLLREDLIEADEDSRLIGGSEFHK